MSLTAFNSAATLSESKGVDVTKPGEQQTCHHHRPGLDFDNS